jgi:AICAR transformylase/IMP cyclohydrolase PurH
MSEKYAFIKAENVDFISEFAITLHEADFKLLSSGGTAQLIRQHKVPVCEVREVYAPFMSDAVKSLPSHSQRELRGAMIIQSLSLHRSELYAAGMPFVNLAYINLEKPRRDLDRPGVHTDKSGIAMIWAAIEGGRSILNQPTQLTAPWVDEVLSPGNKSSEAAVNAELAVQAATYLREYAQVCDADIFQEARRTVRGEVR